jgi:hypothetical protein
MRRTTQSGVAALLFIAALIGGVAWLTIGALANSARGTAERETRTGLALQSGKQALLAYVAKQAATTTENTPGRLPCPESLSQPGTTSEGIAPPIVGLFPTCPSVGRLPWKTLGIDQPRDGSGEPLWYAVATGTWALVNSSTSLSINPGLANQLAYDGAPNAVVAVIIAPGTAMNTLSMTSPPAGCTQVGQQANRYALPYVPANFLECSNATGSYLTITPTDWGNDRTLSITAAEVMAAIMGAVADRLQRQVAPALADWRATDSNTLWGNNFLAYASTFSNPASNAMCGSWNVREGLMPVAKSATSSCTNWGSGSVSLLFGLFGSSSCGQVGSNYQCQFTNLLGGLALRTRIRATAPNVGMSFRGVITAADVSVSNGGTISNFSLTLDNSTGDVDIDFRVQMPLLAVNTVVTVSFPNLPDAALFADSRIAWFIDNDWARYAYYAIARGSRLQPGASCSGSGDADCMDLNGLPAANGNTDDKRFVLGLWGPALASQSRSCLTDADSNGVMDCDERTQYIESRASAASYHQDTITSVFNDRLATCPFQQTPPAPAAVVTICN